MFSAIVAAKAAANARQLDEAIYAAYIGAALGRVKKMPKLKDVLPSSANKQRRSAPQPWEQMFAAARQWTAANK